MRQLVFRIERLILCDILLRKYRVTYETNFGLVCEHVSREV